MLLPLVELIFGEDFLRGGSNHQLRTIQAYAGPENTSGSGGVEVNARAKEREDWKQQFHAAGMVHEESADDSEQGGESNKEATVERLSKT